MHMRNETWRTECIFIYVGGGVIKYQQCNYHVCIYKRTFSKLMITALIKWQVFFSFSRHQNDDVERSWENIFLCAFQKSIIFFQFYSLSHDLLHSTVTPCVS